MGQTKRSKTNKKSDQVFDRLPQIKLVIIGTQEVGKTTLIRKLTQKEIQVEEGKEKKSREIDIIPWELTCQLEDGTWEAIKIHLWDFGEKELLYHTYRFFFTERSFYLLVWEAKQKESTNFDYWLNTIKQLSAGSPVIVVMNKTDLHTEYIDKGALKKRFDNIVDFIGVSCVTGKGIPELIEQIRTCLSRMPLARDKLPKSLGRVFHRLKEENKYYITMDHYFDICKEFGLDHEQAVLFSGYLHDLGLILHYHLDRLLYNTIILDSQWANGWVCDVMGSQKIRENKGIFNFEDLKDYCDPVIYPREKHTQLVRLMEKFEICFNINGTDQYIIPQLLSEDRPSITLERCKGEVTLQLQYLYDHMPENIIGHLISRLFYSIKDNHYWKNGVELEYEDSIALVLTEPSIRKLEIIVYKTWKTELLAIIRNNIEQIHQKLNMEKEMHYNEVVPCNCSECSQSEDPHLFKYDILKKFNIEKKVFINCPVSVEDVEVNKLLKGIEFRQTETQLIQKAISEVKEGVLPFFKSPKDITKKVIPRENMEAHLSSIVIKKYKALEDLKINNLNRINFFAGDNNSGKSSLLEALYLLVNLNDIYSFFDTLRIRGKWGVGLVPAWIDDQFWEAIDIRGVFGHEPVEIKIIKEEEKDVDLDKSLYLSTIRIDSIYGKEKFDGKSRLFQYNPPQSLIHSIKVLCNSLFSTPFSLLNRDDMSLPYEKSVETKTTDKILRFLKKYVDKDIEKIEYVGGAMNRFLVTHTRFARAVDLTQFGEGVQRIYHITLQFASAQNGILLIDELENAIHYQLLTHFARFIHQLSREFNTQVFITSHSKECIDAFFKDKSQHQNISAYRLEREGNQIKCKFISGPRLARLIESIDEDLRGNE